MNNPSVTNFGCLVKAGQTEIRQRAIPELKDTDVLLRMEACNVCTTDYQQWMGLREHQGYPMAGGHEASGVVIDIGSKVTDLKPGDKVAFGYEGCGHCQSCRQGNFGECINKIKITDDGYYCGYFGFSDYVVKPVHSLYKVNKNLSGSEAAFLEPLGTVIHGLKKAHLKAFETVVVIGAGTMGLINAQTARAYGARVIVSEILDNKIEVAKSMGFEVIDGKSVNAVEEVMRLTEGKGADLVIPAVGNSKAYQQALDMLKKVDGRFLVFAAGYPAPKMDIDPNEIHYRRIEIIGTFCANDEDFSEAATALSHRIVDVSKLLENQKYDLKSIQDAFAYASQPGKYRVSVLLDVEI